MQFEENIVFVLDNKIEKDTSLKLITENICRIKPPQCYSIRHLISYSSIAWRQIE